jgi:hypothetical protein
MPTLPKNKMNYASSYAFFLQRVAARFRHLFQSLSPHSGRPRPAALSSGIAAGA